MAVAPSPPRDVWVDERLVVGESPIQGQGLFADDHIPAGTIVIRLGGRLVTGDELDAMITAAESRPRAPYVDTITVTDEAHLVIPGGTIAHYGNHSCDPTLWHVGPYELATRRELEAGEEATIDYGTQSGADDFVMACRCGSARCRGKVSSHDWRLPDLQERYRGHWVPALQHRIESMESMSDDVLAGQYIDDRNLRARQRLWEVSRSEPPLDFNRWSVKLLEAGAGDVVLDAGCGNGRPLALLRQQDCHAVGVDLSIGMARQVEHPFAAAGDIQRLPFRNDAFDAAAAFMMLYHVPDQAAAAAELRRVVKPGGVVVVTTASKDNQAELRALVEGIVGDGWTWDRPSATSFHLEGGADVLRRAFESVEVIDAPRRRISVTDADAMADYVASSGDHFGRTLPSGRSWDEVVAGVRAATAAAIATNGALTLTARLGALVCR